jgi:hypothetical protein
MVGPQSNPRSSDVSSSACRSEQLSPEPCAKPSSRLESDDRRPVLLGLTLADAVISNIDSKNRWNFWRPITAIQERGEQGWIPFLLTPPNQEYPAGHPMISGSGLYLLAKFFPGRLRQPLHATSPSCGPRTFLSLSDAVEDVIGARVWGGMHFRNSGEVGAGIGKKLAHWVYPRYLLPLEDAQ